MHSAEPQALLVRHGPRRGRHYGYLQMAIDHLRAEHPQTFARLQLHETAGAMPSLDGIGGVMFWLADPLRELYPDCYAEACAIADEARRRGLPIVNPPEALSNARKSEQARRWLAAGLPTPAVTRFGSHAELLDLAPRFDYPVILRGDELHAQRKLHLCADVQSVRALAVGKLAFPGVASHFVDPRPGYRASHGLDHVFARLFHQRRAFVFGGHVCFHHMYFSHSPIVTTPSSTFARYTGWREHVLPKSEELRRCIAEDVSYWREGDGHAPLLARAAETLDLGFCGFDYITQADGSALLFECNPYFTLSTLRQATLPRERRIAERYAGYWRVLAALVDRLAGGTVLQSAAVEG